MLKKYRNKLLLLVVLVITGISLQLLGLFEPQRWIGAARGYADNSWMIALLILAQAVLFTFALAGSLFLWVAATLYDPVTSTLILASGAVLGGISAYYFSRRITDEWVHKIENTHVYRLLQKHDNFFTQFALRVMPAFPHSIINYSSGILNIRMRYFIPAAFLGIATKSYIFSRVINQAVNSASVEDLLDLKVLAPLIILSVVILAGVILKMRLAERQPGTEAKP